MATATTGQLTQTLAQLRKRTAQRLGDYVQLTGTTNGSTTTFIDSRNVNTGTEDMKGRVILFSDGTTSRITAQVDATNTLTFTPAVSSATIVESGDTAEVFNKRGKGFLPVEYKDAINAAINDAYPLGLILTSDDGGAFDIDSPDVTVDTALVCVSAVYWEDADGRETLFPRATRSNQYGWVPLPETGKVRLQGVPAEGIDGLNLRFVGYGRQEILTADSDTCVLNAEYVISRACYHLCLSAIDRDPMYGQMVGIFLQESQRMRTRVRTMKDGTCYPVRSY